MSLADFLAGASQAERGRRAERDAVVWLERRGYRVLERNVTSRFGEIDLVARDGDTLCFVEIKARRSLRRGSPLAAVTPDKQRRLTRCALSYLARSRHRGPSRFDVLGMAAAGSEWSFELVTNAFDATE